MIPDSEPTIAASTPAVTFESGGERLIGLLHLPAGPGPHPVVVLMHGFPGNERNFDLAQELRRAGFAALVFHYRGSWGVGGSYSWSSVLEDAARVVAQVRTPAYAGPHRLDPERVAVVGHSLGGFAALMTTAADPGVRAAASVAGFDFGAVAAQCRAEPDRLADYVEAFGEDLLPLRGTSGEALAAEFEAAGDAWRLARLAPRLADRPILLLGTGPRDGITPAAMHHHPLVDAYAELVDLEHHVFETDHSLSDHRVELASTLIDFLDRRLCRLP